MFVEDNGGGSKNKLGLSKVFQNLSIILKSLDPQQTIFQRKLLFYENPMCHHKGRLLKL